jgi:serine/threonine protein kinase
MPRQQLKDEYEIIGEIGAGGMATVYKAVQKSLERTVAIKELKKAYHADIQIVKRFERESKVAASLQHENIVHIYDYWNKPTYGIVMEYVDGANFADVIEKTGALPVDVGAMIAIQVSNALDYAHMRGFIHRDIKPSNIMIKRNGEVKLMDFGIAHTRNLEALTMPGTLIGTPAYMSPEQILGQQLDVRSDVFSFGVVLYEMFTGVKPFSDDDTRSVTARILKDKFLDPRRINREIPLRLQWLIKKCLRKKPHKRYGSMLEVERKLGRLLAGRTTKAASLLRIADYLVSRKIFEAVPEQETVIITSKPASERWRKGALVAAAVFLLMAGAASYFNRGKASKEALPIPTVVPVQQAMPASLAAHPLAITAVSPTAPDTALAQDTPDSSLSLTQPEPLLTVETPGSSPSLTPPAPLPSLASSSVDTILSAPSASAGVIEPDKKRTPTAGKKATSVKKKKKKKMKKKTTKSDQ